MESGARCWVQVPYFRPKLFILGMLSAMVATLHTAGMLTPWRSAREDDHHLISQLKVELVLTDDSFPLLSITLTSNWV